MFVDIGFWELALIGLVALIVIGPERLPGVARTVGSWVGRTRRFVAKMKDDIDREMKQEELRKAIERDAGLDELKKIINEQYSFEDEPEARTDYVVKTNEQLIKEAEEREAGRPQAEEDFDYGLGDHSDHGVTEQKESLQATSAESSSDSGHGKKTEEKS